MPIEEFIPQIIHTLSTQNNLVVQAEPGAGKSTVLPLHLLDANILDGKKIVMLEPRRVAAKSIAHYLARKIGEKPGGKIGYQIKNEKRSSRETVLEIITEGILTRRLQNNPELPEVGLIIFDEFHERSVHADLSLLLALEAQQTIREDLKLLVMSATIDTGLIASYLGNAGTIQCPGRAYPVSVSYTNQGQEQLAKTVITVLDTHLKNDAAGDVLVFLPGVAEINRCLALAKELLTNTHNVVPLPLHGSLSLEQQEHALHPAPNGRRRVIFSTNIAETSLTIEGIRCVIDSGLERALVYDPSNCMSRLQTRPISKASAEQRKGRAGRTQEGKCIRLWSEQKHSSLSNFQAEEILSVDLSGVLLELCLWGAGSYEDINWLTPPPKAHFDSARNTLLQLGLIDTNNSISALGKKALTFALPPRLAVMLLTTEHQEEKQIACRLAALLSEKDIFLQHRSIDIIERLLAIEEYQDKPKTALKVYPIKNATLKSLEKNEQVFKSQLGLNNTRFNAGLAKLQSITPKLLLMAYPDRLAKRRSNGSGRYQLANGKGIFLYDDDPLFGSEWLVVADCDAQKTEGRIYSATTISSEQLMDSIGSSLITEDTVKYEHSSRTIRASRISKYGSIIIRKVALPSIPQETFNQSLTLAIKDYGLGMLNWTKSCDAWLKRAEWLAKQVDDFPDISKAFLIAKLDDWLIPYLTGHNTLEKVNKLSIHKLLVNILTWEQQQTLNMEAPTEFVTPGNKIVPIKYDENQGPTVSIQLQELFGQLDSPMLGGGKIPLRFELLSPARRPIQTTSDLLNFWHSSYIEVAKEMRGKYPKHRWPIDPLQEQAGRSIKDRKKR